MYNKVANILLHILLTAVPAAYLFLSSTLSGSVREETRCKEIEIRILDSTHNRFVTEAEIRRLIFQEGISTGESKIKHINTYSLEETVNKRTAVRVSQVSVTERGKLRVDILQRRPILRIETANGGFYMDNEAYIFPLMSNYSSYVPVVTGHVPLKIPEGYKGESNPEDYWTSKIYDLALYMQKNKFWNSMIEQVYIDNKGVLYMTPRVGRTDIIFGTPENIDTKFKKLYAFYSKVIPETGWDTYKSVNLSFNSQLVCKKR